MSDDVLSDAQYSNHSDDVTTMAPAASTTNAAADASMPRGASPDSAPSSPSPPPLSPRRTARGRGCGCPARRSPLVNAVHLSLSFCLIFLAFAVAQNSQTTLDPAVGAVGLGVLYAVFTLSNTFSAWLVNATDVRLSLFFGALTYALYVAANIRTEPALLYASSALIGLGAAVLWTAQGGYIADCSGRHERERGLPAHSTMGWFNGIFFALFQANQFVGNLLAALLYAQSATQAAVFSVMTVICGCGVATLLLLPKTDDRGVKQQQHQPPALDDDAQHAEKARIVHAERGYSEADMQEGTEEDLDGDGSDAAAAADGSITARSAPRSFRCSSVLSSLLLLRDLRLLLLLPLIVYSGLCQSWIYGAFPPLIAGNERRFFVLAFFGAADALSSYVMGRLSDTVGRLPILVVGFLAHSAVFLFLVLGFAPAIVQGPNPDPVNSGQPIVYMDLALPWFFVLALLLGLGDGVFNTQAYAILGTFFKAKAEMAFASTTAGPRPAARICIVPHRL